jgi:serine/threonine protein kinase
LDPNKEFIAKKVREGSNELEMLRLLNTIPLKSDHFIWLIESFHGWAILPKMVTVTGYVEFAPDLFESNVYQVCLDLILGLAHLHGHCVAHRDIKPDNLVVDQNFRLKIIDFDIAMRVEDEDEEVDDQCGTKKWMAPEVEKKLRHSPIKADRWACGRVLLFLLDKFHKGNKSLRAFAKNLMALNPRQRPSLYEWCNHPAPSFSDVGITRNVDARKASRPRRDSLKVDGENTKLPIVKKQRLDGSGQYDTTFSHYRARNRRWLPTQIKPMTSPQTHPLSTLRANRLTTHCRPGSVFTSGPCLLQALICHVILQAPPAPANCDGQWQPESRREG